MSAADPLMVLMWQEAFDQQYAGETSVKESGIIQMRNIHNGFVLTGDLEGYCHVYGRAMIDTKTGMGTGSGTSEYVLTQPGVGTLECNWASKIYDFPIFVQFGHYTCKGTGYYEGWKVKVATDNEARPGIGIYDATGEFR